MSAARLELITEVMIKKTQHDTYASGIEIMQHYVRMKNEWANIMESINKK